MAGSKLKPSLGHVDVAAVGGEVARRAGVVGFAHQPPDRVGPVLQPGVAACTFAGVSHVVHDQRIADTGLDEQRIERDEKRSGIVVLVKAKGVENGSQAVQHQVVARQSA